MPEEASVVAAFAMGMHELRATILFKHPTSSVCVIVQQ